MDEAMGYVLSLAAVSTVVVGCRTPAEVDDNVRIARQFLPFGEERCACWRTGRDSTPRHFRITRRSPLTGRSPVHSGRV